VTEAQPVPDLTDLLKDSPSNWGKWGEDDEVGSLNVTGQVGWGNQGRPSASCTSAW